MLSQDLKIASNKGNSGSIFAIGEVKEIEAVSMCLNIDVETWKMSLCHSFFGIGSRWSCIFFLDD